MDEAILSEFIEDSLEHLDKCEPYFLAMEKEGAAVDQETVNAAFRAIHSIKGSSGLVGFWPVRDLSHAMESLLIHFRERTMEPDSDKITVLLQAADKLRLLISHGPKGDSAPSYQEELNSLRAVLGDSEVPEALPSALGTEAETSLGGLGADKPEAEACTLDLSNEIMRLRSIASQTEACEDERIYQVLVVEDDKFTARMLRDRIEAEEEFEVVLAHSMAEAVAAIDSGQYDFFVAVLDLTLADAPDGEVVDAVISRGVPPIILTATFNDEVRQRLLAKQAIDYLLKGGASDLDYLVSLLQRLRKNKRIKTLAVDDSRPQRTMLKGLLELLNFQVLEAEDGRQALEVMKKHPDIRMVITDYNMPNMDGIELVTSLRANYSRDRLAVIGLSSEATASLSAGFLKGGANDFLPKPYTKEEIYSRIIQNLELQENINKIRESSQRDYLTQLPNRRYFFETAAPLHRLARRAGHGLAMAMMDIDYFKKVNDTYGHAAGDEVLKAIARTLNFAFGQIGLVARLGGEEFGAMVPGVNPAAALVIFNEVRKIIERATVEWSGQRLSVTVSIGVAVTPGEDLERMISKADTLLYEAKQQGRNRVVME